MTADCFYFKRFSVRQERCGMKVGTDAVLLGAWANGGRRILDIGTGTGVIALMMAQRFPNSVVAAIDIDADAYIQAAANVSDSPFFDRVEVVLCRVQDFTGSEKFDCIVSNPPYFTDGLRNPIVKRSLARHTDTLSYSDLFAAVDRLLTDDGVFSTIIPTECSDRFIAEGCLAGFVITRRSIVRTTTDKQPRRLLMTFTRHKASVTEISEIVLHDDEGNTTEQYRRLTSDFYL